MPKFSYEVVNFSGIPYDKPEKMRRGRVEYVQQHLYINEFIKSDFALIKKNERIKQAYIDVFKDLPLGNQHLPELIRMLRQIHDDDEMDTLSIFHCEQVIGRVLRVLNRPKNPTIEQINEYNGNLSETLKLAKDLSGFGFNWRKVGRWLMTFALAVAVSAGIAFFLVSAPVSFALAGTAVFLGVIGLCLKQFTSLTMDELVTDFVNNVKPFSSYDLGVSDRCSMGDRGGGR